jgi:MFS family permease
MWRMGSHIAVLAAVGRSAVLRRIEGGFLLFSMAEWATWLAIVIVAFDRGGATEAGIVGFAIGVPSIVIAPVAAILGDRWPRARVLIASYALQALAMTGTALALMTGPVPVAYLMAAIAMTTVGLSRPALSAMLPEVVDSPDELTAANVTSGIVEGTGALAGPLAAGILLGVGGGSLVYVVSAVGVAMAAVALYPIARASDPVPRSEEAAEADRGIGGAVSDLARDLTAGATAILADHRLTGVLAVLAACICLLGALGVFTVVIAIDLLGLDESAVGFLTAASGLGALLGSVAAVALVGRERLSGPLLVSTIAFGVTVAMLGVVRAPVLVVAVFVATGIGWSFANVAATTLTQRLAGDDVMTRVFGVSEAVMVAAEALGGLLVPLLIVLFGPGDALIVAGLALPIVALAATPAFLRADRAGEEHLRELRVIRAVPMFRPLSAPVLERLASDATTVAAAAGSTVIREGERGDRFYVVVEGRAEVQVHGIATRTLGPGDAFGEIALLHDIPRTATVLAIDPTQLVAIEREPFLVALTGQPRSRAMAVQLATRHLARDPSDPNAGLDAVDPQR